MKNSRNGFHNDSDFSFDGENSFHSNSHAQQPAASGPEQKGTVKWFNSEKGFGFVGLEDGSGDAFLHINNVSEKGLQTPMPGATVMVRVADGAKGKQVVELVSLDLSTATPDADPRHSGGSAPRSSAPRGGRFPAPDMSNAREVKGTVKWYNSTKGFGFIAPDNGEKDVFIHASSLERCGLSGLADGQSVNMKVTQGAKGPEAVEISAA